MRRIFYLLILLFILIIPSLSFAGMEKWDGKTWTAVLTPNVYKTFDIAVCGTEATIWTPATGKKFRMMGIAVAPSAAAAMTFKDNTAGTTILIARAGAGIPSTINFENGILSTTANNLLTIQSSAAAICSGTVWGIEE